MHMTGNYSVYILSISMYCIYLVAVVNRLENGMVRGHISSAETPYVYTVPSRCSS